MTTESYIGFYPSMPFWAVAPIDFDDPTLPDKLTDLMEEVVFTFDEVPFKIKICRDGMILFRNDCFEISEDERSGRTIEDLVSQWGKYLDYLNAIYFLIDSATCKIQKFAHFNLSEITHRDAFRITLENNKFKSASIDFKSVSGIYHMARYKSSYSSGLPLKFDPRISMRLVIKLNVLEETIRLFNLIKDDYKTIKMVSNVAKSLSEYKIGNYDTSLILSWFVIETVLNEKWHAYLNSKNASYPSGQERINSDRKQYFTGRDFPVSLVSNMLEISDIIDFKLFKDIDDVRGYRNKIVHNHSGFNTEPSHCQLAISKAIELALEKHSLSIVPNLSYSVTGL